MGEALPAVLEAAGSASEYVRSATAPAPINAAIDSAPDPAHLSWWWLCKGILQAAKGDRLASQFNRRQPVLRAVLNDVEETIATFLAGSRVMSGGGQADLEGAVRMAVWGLHAAQSAPAWAPAPAPAMPSAADAAAEAFLSTLPDTSVATVYHAIRQLPYGGVGQLRSVEGVLSQRRGSCSGKHLARKARSNALCSSVPAVTQV